MSISKTFSISDIYEFHLDDEIEDVNSRTSSSEVRVNDEDKIDELAKEYMDHVEHVKRTRNKNTQFSFL